MTASDRGHEAEADRWQKLITATMSQDQFLRMKCLEMAVQASPNADLGWQVIKAKGFYREITEGEWTPQDRS